MNATELKIKILGDSILRKKARLIKEIAQSHRDILIHMSRVMYESSGVGLAAPQVGINQSMAVIDIGKGLYKLINLRILKKEGRQSMEEGCLSVPGVSIKVRRAKKVLVKALDESGKNVTIEADGLLACVFQHEIDHLNGKLIIDYASLFDKLKIRNKLEELKKRARNEKMRESGTKSGKLQL